MICRWSSFEYFFVLLLLCAPFPAFCQYTSKSNSILYCSVFENDFKSSRFGGTVKRMEPGLSINYFRGIKGKFDFSIDVKGSFADSVLKNERNRDKRLLLGLESGARFRFFNGSRVVHPYFYSGVLLSKYNATVALYLSPSTGLQFNFKSVYLITDLGYSLSINRGFNNYFHYSIGIGGRLSQNKPAAVIPRSYPLKNYVAKDTDGDGILDPEDDCPNIPGLLQYKGCPDTDSDGIQDKEDSCPNMKGLIRYHGCPIPDTDADGINDEEDSCVTKPGFVKYHGCPIPDYDKDGVNDEEDLCIDVRGIVENHGCPVIDVETIKQLNKAAENILFKTGSYELMPSSYTSLEKVLQILRQNEKLKLLIEGHTDNVGNERDNQLLSESRALKVLEFFKNKGIAISRLHSVGFGYQQPQSDNRTSFGRAENRRVVFKLFY